MSSSWLCAGVEEGKLYSTKYVLGKEWLLNLLDSVDNKEIIYYNYCACRNYLLTLQDSATLMFSLMFLEQKTDSLLSFYYYYYYTAWLKIKQGLNIHVVTLSQKTYFTLENKPVLNPASIMKCRFLFLFYNFPQLFQESRSFTEVPNLMKTAQIYWSFV